MKRRTFVLAGIGAASAAAAWQFIDVSTESTIEAIVRKRLDYLKLDPDGVRRFAKDAAALHNVSNFRMHMIGGLAPIYSRYAMSSGHNSLAYLLRHGEDRIVGSYLISSDFFTNGADMTRVVHYERMLDPRRACGNPFARSPV